jgi:hypothetical protein
VVRLTGEVAGRLDALEAVIERGLRTFVEVGAALGEIRDRKLYKDEYATFDAYCRERWGFGKTYASRQIMASRVVKELPTGNVLPANEAQARELARIADPEERAEVWGEEAREAEREGRAPSAEGVKAKAAAREAPPSEEPLLPIPAEPERERHDGQVGYLMRKALRHLGGRLDPSRSRPEEAARSMERVDDGAELAEGLRAYAAWLVRVAEELERLREAEQEEQERAYQARITGRRDKEERSDFYQTIRALGGIKTHDDELREEYRAIPNAYKSKNGLAGDVIASMLAQHHPQFGVTDERSLMDTFNRMGPSGRGREG